MTTITGVDPTPTLDEQLDDKTEFAAGAFFAAMETLAVASTAATQAAGQNRPLTSGEQAALTFALTNAGLCLGAYQTMACLTAEPAEPGPFDEATPLQSVPDSFGPTACTVADVPIDRCHEVRWPRNWSGSPWEPWRHVVGEQIEVDDRYRTLIFADRSTKRLRADHGVQIRAIRGGALEDVLREAAHDDPATGERP